MVATANATARVANELMDRLRDVSSRLETSASAEPSRVEARGTKRNGSARESKPRKPDASETEEEDHVATKPKKPRTTARKDSLASNETKPTPTRSVEASQTNLLVFNLAVSKALGVARKLENATKATHTPPTKKELSEVVKMLVEILPTVNLQDGRRLGTLTGGHFVQLLLVMERLFGVLKHRRFSVALVKSVINAIDKAMARDPVLAPLSQYRDKFAEIKAEMETSGVIESDQTEEPVQVEAIVSRDDAQPSPATTIPGVERGKDQSTVVDANSPANEVVQAQRLGEILANSPTQDLSEDQLEAFTDALVRVLTNRNLRPGQTSQSATNGIFKGLFAMATRVLDRPGNRLNAAPFIKRIVSAMDHARGRDQGLASLMQYRTHFATIGASNQGNGANGKDKLMSKAQKVAFETLTRSANKLLALPMGERSKQVTQYIDTLGHELKKVFPTKKDLHWPTSPKIQSAS